MMPAAPVQTLVDRVTTLAFDRHVLRAGFLGDEMLFVFADGGIQLGREAAPLHPHADAILVAAHSGTRLLTGGDDGRIVETGPDGRSVEIGNEKGRWIDAVALGPDGSAGWSAGKNVTVRDSKGRLKTLTAPSTPQGLAFAPKGYRLAIAHIDGVTLWFPNAHAEPERLTWKGPHLDTSFSPDNRFLITSMQENQLHGWRLADKGHMRMSGYPSKTRSWSWSHDGLWLATSGAEAAIIWPFAKEGPTGKAPRECGIRPAKVSCVAFHPRALVLAIGYEDGWVLLVRLTDASELLVRAGGDGTPITALGWDRDGKRLVFGSASGGAGLLALPV
ncbi:MAG: WD40 repeat domain-containing protein [Beijerinckiaceae bacterium]|nr:WD40 repeat domain-containing protein [Beijerinckiaceae bacterium]